MMDTPEPYHITLQRLREYMLANDRPGAVYRELWKCNNSTYLAYRSYLSTLPSRGLHRQSGTGGAQDHHTGEAAARASAAPYAAPKYTFDGVKFVCDESHSAVSVLAFANVRNDLLAFANNDGDMWLLQLPPDGEQEAGRQGPVVRKAPKVHARAITAMDWSFDNSQLLSVGDDGAVCIWDTSSAGPAAGVSCIRSIALRVPLTCCAFHRLNPNLAFVGSAAGWLELYNCSAGTLHQKYQVSGAFQWDLQVTAVEVSNHHVFVGDSQGFLHLYRSEMHDGQVKQLVWHTKLHVARSQKAAVIEIQFVPFCRATDTPILVCTCRDGTIALVRIHEKHHRIDVHSWCAASAMARNIRASVCPLSAIQDVPRITMGAEDTNVYIFNIAGGSRKPVVVNTLKGHRAPVVDVSFAFDESLLASGDSEGTVIVWRRSALAS